MKFSEKLKIIRKEEGYTQKSLGEILGSSEISIRFYEIGKSKPHYKFIEKLCKLHPEYALWLMTGKTQPPYQISPIDKNKQGE